MEQKTRPTQTTTTKKSQMLDNIKIRKLQKLRRKLKTKNCKITKNTIFNTKTTNTTIYTKENEY